MALSYLEEKSIEFDIVEYLKDKLSYVQLKELIDQLGIEPFGLVRKSEPAFKENYKHLNKTEVDWVQAMIDHPKLIERPIVVRENRAVVARPTENINDLFS